VTDTNVQIMRGALRESLKKANPESKALTRRQEIAEAVLQLAPVFFEAGVKWFPANMCQEPLILGGVFERPKPESGDKHGPARAIGDALGTHKGGLGLESKWLNGTTHYSAADLMDRYKSRRKASPS
jgi:hypothetical protein